MAEKEQEALLQMMDEVAQDMKTMGFPLDLEHINVEVHDQEAMAGLFEKISDDSTQNVGPITSFGPRVVEVTTDEPDNGAKENRLAFYDPNSKTIVFQKGASGTITKGYLAHELAHVYQDQRWGFDRIWQSYQNMPSREMFNITQFLIEGYAELVRQTYEQNEADNNREINALSLVLGKYAEAECIECFAVKSMVNLPYSLGLRFLVHQFREGGWSLVDNVFQDLPTSTEQIIHPKKLNKDEPTSVTLPTMSDRSLGLKKVSEGKLGEAFLLSKLLSMAMPIKQAFECASGFDGDLSQLYQSDGGQEVLIWRIVFDRVIDAEQLSERILALDKPYTLMRTGRVVDWIVSDSERLTNKMRIFLSKHPLSLEGNAVDEETTREQEITMKNEQGLLKNPYYD